MPKHDSQSTSLLIMTYPKTTNSQINKEQAKLRKYERELSEKLARRPNDGDDWILECSIRFTKLKIRDSRRKLQNLFWSQF